ncbi:MAG: BMP family ABC transporter substrate-binding protein, partial [Alphaproteobacteria bacterium]
MTILNRRALVAGAAALGVAGPALAQARKVKVAAIYTVPVEQQWVSRIHKAINAAVARGDAERGGAGDEGAAVEDGHTNRSGFWTGGQLV